MSDALQHWKKERRGTKNINEKKKQNKKDFQKNIYGATISAIKILQIHEFEVKSKFEAKWYQDEQLKKFC